MKAVPLSGGIKPDGAPFGHSKGALLSNKATSGDMAQCLQSALDKTPSDMDVTICYSGRSSLEPNTVEMPKGAPWFAAAQGTTCNGAK